MKYKESSVNWLMSLNDVNKFIELCKQAKDTF